MSRQRLECAELAPALVRPRPFESASKLVALHTLRESGRQQPIPRLHLVTANAHRGRPAPEPPESVSGVAGPCFGAATCWKLPLLKPCTLPSLSNVVWLPSGIRASIRNICG